MHEIRVAVAQIEVTPGHPNVNTKKILQVIAESRTAGDDIIVFPEMAVPGYLLGDEWENEAFVRDCYSFNDDIRQATQGIVAIWGNIDIDPTLRSEDGRLRKYNAAFVAQNGHFIGTGAIHKTLMPKYREFDDSRHFYSLRKEAQDNGLPISKMLVPLAISIRDKVCKTGIILCEDMWSDDYTVNPIDILLQNGAEAIINLSCSPWTWRKNNKRHQVIRDRLHRHPVHFVYANNTGIQNNGKNIFLFDGNSTIYHPNGSLIAVARDYTEEVLRAALFTEPYNKVPMVPLSDERDCSELYAGLIYGIRKFFEKFSSQRVVIGLSGGIDSALSATLLVKALGAENVYAVNMPSQFNSATTIGAAGQLARNLGIHYTSIAIQQSVENTVREVQNAIFERQDALLEKTSLQLTGLNCENIQARDRGSRVLAAVASALGAVFVNNGNKTETAFGYATLYGDVNGALAPIADLYKTEVYELARHINQINGFAIIPETIFEIPASAELSADQNVDQGKGDPIVYPYHDKLVRAFVEFRLDPEDILRHYLAGTLSQILRCDDGLIGQTFPDAGAFVADLEHKWRLFKTAYFKRIQSPPILTVSKRAFGYDLREAQNGVYFTRKYQEMKAELIK